MTPELSTQMRMQQVQILAPQLQQSLKILQLPTMELQGLIAQQLATNPALEEYDPSRDSSDTQDMQAFDPDVQDATQQREEQRHSIAEDDVANAGKDEPREAVLEKELDQTTVDDEWAGHYEAANKFGERITDGIRAERSPNEDEEYSYRMQSLASDETLADDLHEQIASLDLPAEEHEVIDYLTDSLDESGFLREAPAEIAAALHKDVALVERCIATLKTLEPVGIGARDLRESLLMQLQAQQKTDGLAWRIIQDYYQDLLHNRLERITRGLDASMERVQAAIKEIGRLDPRPGRDLSAGLTPVLRPDIVVTKSEAGEYTVDMNDNLLPYVRVSTRVRETVRNKLADRQQLSFLREQIRNGEALINNLQFRKRTIVAVAEAIVQRQREFMEEGPTFLKPLTMKEVAEMVGVHEATISRTVNDKYMATPQGVYEMRHFFSSAVSDDKENGVSTNAVKAKLQELIAAEDRQHPLSDDLLAEKLKQEGFAVARRTVVKYRQALGIANARQRKVFV